MAKVPTILSNSDVGTPGRVPQVGFSVVENTMQGGRAISQGLNDIASGVNHQINKNQAKLQEKQAYDNHLWSESQFTTAQRDWSQWISNVQQNGSEQVIEQFKKEFPKYQQEMLKAAPNEDAANRLKLKLDDLGSQVFSSSLHIEAGNRSQNTINTFDKMLQDSTDTISRAPDAYAGNQERLMASLDAAKAGKRINDQVYLKLKQNIDDLAVTAAQAAVGSDPDKAQKIIDGATGIDWARRKATLGEIERARSSNDALFKYQQDELLKSNLDAITDTGKPMDKFDIEAYVHAQPKEHQAAARELVANSIAKAQEVFVGKSNLLGKSPGQIGQVLQQLKPDPSDPKYHDKSEVFDHLAKVADSQVKLFEKDPFTFSRQDPVVDKSWKMIEELPKDAKPELVQHLTKQALDASVNFQRMHGVPEAKISVLSNQSATDIAAQINSGDLKQVQDKFVQLQQTYGSHYQEAFRDLVRLPEGQRIDAGTQILALHTGKPWLPDFLAAIRTPDSDLKVDTKDAQQIRELALTAPGLMAFRGAMLSANPAAQSTTGEYTKAISKFATSMLYSGKARNPTEAVKTATDLVINQAYGFANVNDIPVAVKRNIGSTSFTDSDVKVIGSALQNMQGIVQPAHVDTRRFAFPDGLSEDARLKSVGNTLKNDSFWVTNPQNDGASLYMHGMDNSSAPVKLKSGRQIEVKFADALQYGNRMNERNKQEFMGHLLLPITGLVPLAQ